MKCNSIGEKLLFTVVRLEGKIPGGTSIGTGFLYQYKDRLFLVTNKHVVQGVYEGSYVMMKADTSVHNWKPIIGQGVRFTFKASDFLGHPDPKVDVAVANISLKVTEAKQQNNPVYCLRVDSGIIPTQEQFDKFINPLEEVVFIGYPSGLWDEKNLLPIMRKGITATPCYYDFMGEKKFLIDASVFPGSSGSPVFIYYSGGYHDNEGGLYAGTFICFLGIIAQTYHRLEEGEIKVRNIPTSNVPYSQSKQMIDLGIVFKYDTIIETMEEYLKVASILDKKRKSMDK